MTLGERALRFPDDREHYRGRSSPEQAARFIHQRIFDGDLRAGDHVPQDEIASDLGISRIPVREAIITLERQGWVRIERNRGAFVEPIDAQTIRDHYDLSSLVHAFAVRRAVERSGPELGHHLDRIVRHLRSVTDDAVEFSRGARAFRDSIVIAAGSHRVEAALSALPPLVPGHFFVHIPDAIPVEAKGLAAVTRAAVRRDGLTAEAAWAQMMRPISRLVLELFEARGLFQPGDSDAAG